jgi:hypothetical protein
MPAPGQYCFESPQLARYNEGQHFLAHEVGASAFGEAGSGPQGPKPPGLDRLPCIRIQPGPDSPSPSR